ncbi:hypothetical protein AAFC00_000097 [Neodothiora populina]|uniref:Rhodopsin n=1 Tax=Neodothiora populina TaxID=2781224 RepID=A0ABR3P2R8_9PEZI
MAFFFTCGTHTFKSLLQGYENITAQCQNCGNFSAKVYKRWQWFTFCFIPVVPFSLKPYHDVGCHICNFFQDVKYRPDVQAQMNGGGGGGGGGQQNIPMQPYPQQGGPPGGQQVNAGKPAQYV